MAGWLGGWVAGWLGGWVGGWVGGVCLVRRGESWDFDEEEKVKKPYTSMEIQQTQNSCSKQFIL